MLEKSTGLKSKWQKTTGLTLEQADGCPTEISTVRFFFASEGQETKTGKEGWRERERD